MIHSGPINTVNRNQAEILWGFLIQNCSIVKGVVFFYFVCTCVESLAPTAQQCGDVNLIAAHGKA